MTQENVYDENEGEILVVSKHYIPAEVFELKFFHLIYQAGGYPGLHKGQERFPVQVPSAGNTKGVKILLKSRFPKFATRIAQTGKFLKT